MRSRAVLERDAGRRTSPGWRRAAQVAMYVVSGALVARCLAPLADRCWWAVRCPYEIFYGEGGLLQEAMTLARGGGIYNDFRHYPFLVATYPPFYSLLSAAGVRLFGAGFAFGRALSVVATLGIAVLIWGIVRRVARSHFAAAGAAVLFLAAPIVRLWAPAMRVDMVGMLLGLGALYCVLRGRRWLIPAAALMVLAVYTRQSEVASLAAGVAYLWWVRERKQAALLVGGWAAATAAVFGALQVASHGWFYHHIVISNQNLWDLGQFALLWRSAVREWPAPFLLGLAGAAVALARFGETAPGRDGEGHNARLLGLYFVFAALISITAGKVGAYVNYMLQPLAASCLLSAVAYDRLEPHLGSARGRAAWVALWLVVVVSLLLRLLDPMARAGGAETRWRRRFEAEQAQAVALIRRTPGDVLSEIVGLPLVAGRPVLLEPFEFSQMAVVGNWDERPVVRDIERHRFSLIILKWWNPSHPAPDKWGTYGNGCWTRAMTRAMRRHYHLAATAGELYFMKPNEPPPAGPPVMGPHAGRAAYVERPQSLGVRSSG